MKTPKTGPIALAEDVFKRSQERHAKLISARRSKRGGEGRTDGPRRRKGQRSTSIGKRLRVKHRARLLDAPEKTHDVVMGIEIKTGKAVLRLDRRPEKIKEAA